jgi:hypothetical protein
VKHTEQSNVEFGHQLSICSGTKENHGKPWSTWPVAGPSGCELTSSRHLNAFHLRHNQVHRPHPERVGTLQCFNYGFVILAFCVISKNCFWVNLRVVTVVSIIDCRHEWEIKILFPDGNHFVFAFNKTNCKNKYLDTFRSCRNETTHQFSFRTYWR